MVLFDADKSVNAQNSATTQNFPRKAFEHLGLNRLIQIFFFFFTLKPYQRLIEQL